MAVQGEGGIVPSAVPRWTTHRRVWNIIKRSCDEFSEDRIPAVAASITFFFLLALFPAIAAVVSLYGLVADRSAISHELEIVSGFLPAGATAVLEADIHRLATQQPAKLDFGLLTGLVIAIWSASGGAKALMEGLNVAYETRETRSFLHLTFYALGLTAIGVLLATPAIKLAIALPLLVFAFPFGPALAIVFQVLVWPISFAACVVFTSAVYHYGPNRVRTAWRWTTWGGCVAAAIWIAGTVLFTWYVRNYGRYDQVYGNLSSVVGFLTWIWLSLLVLLFGAEINCEIERLHDHD